MQQAGMVLTAWSRLFAGALVRAGIRDAVISPGSRSTPLTWALLQEPALRCTSVLDERSAGFFALGLARESGRPVVLVCTSGTAGAHYFPAVIEASLSSVPLLIVTCDRPVELSQCGAAQTMVQAELYGRFARGFFELGDPCGELDALRSVSRKAAQAVALTRGPTPGPVQINFPAKKPLEPVPLGDGHAEPLLASVQKLLETTPLVHVGRNDPPPYALAHFATKLNSSWRPLLVLGASDPATGRAVAQLAAKLSAPLCAETSAHAPLALPLESVSSIATGLTPPDLVLRFGGTPTSASWAGFVRGLDCPQLVVNAHAYADPTQTATDVVMGDLERVANGLFERCLQKEPSAFLAEWSQAGAVLQNRLVMLLGARTDVEAEAISEPHAVAQLLGALDGSMQVAIGNSLPLRLADAVSPSVFTPQNQPRVFVQRGVNGIDGMIASSAGIALGGQKPTLALLGDVTAAHDLSSLALARQVRVPLCIAVLDNAGGHIFDALPMSAHAENLGENWQFWSTPPGLDFEAAARAYGVAFARPRTEEEIGACAATALRTPGATFLHVVTRSTDTFRWLSTLRQWPG